MSRIVIGKASGRNISLDLNILLRTHLLIWASTGGGKSWLIRRLVEQAFGKFPIILVDSEGEFASLREKFGFVLVGKGGETPADVRSAKEVAEKLMELRASAVCDIFELKHDAKHEWVKTFVNGLIEAPKRLWGPRIIVIDEAHRFCPEKGQGESVAYGAVADLAGVARKRGLGIVLATQRLSKLSKNATAEMYNQAAGPTARQADRDRAAYEMGISGKAETREFSEHLRKMERGTFFFQGRAISMDSILIKVGPVQTTHPEPGSMKYKAGPPPTPKQIKALLPKLADLPKEAEEKAQTVAEFRKQIHSLKAQLRAAPQVAKAAADPRAMQKAVALEVKKNAALRAVLEEAMKMIVKVNAIGFEDTAIKPEEVKEALQATAKAIAKLAGEKITQRAKEFEFLKKQTNRLLARMKTMLSQEDVSVKIDVERTKAFLIQPSPTRPLPTAEFESDAEELTPARKKILCALAEFEALGQSEVSRKWVAALAGVSHKSSAYTNNLGGLRSGGYIDYGTSSTLRFTEKGRAVTPPADPPDSSQEMLQRCLQILTAKQGDILKALHAVHPESLSRDELADGVGVSAKSSAYTNNLGAIRSAGMLDYQSNSTVRCEDWLFID